MSTTVSASAEPQSPPFISIDGIPNFRDLGGYPLATSNSHSVRTGIIYRCGEPTAVTENGIATLKKLGITHFYDLRSLNEIEKNIAAGRGGVKEWEGCERVFVPVFQDRDYSPEALAIRFKDYADGAEGFKRAYTSILESGALGSYKTILLHLANEPDKPLVIHCTAGKDRTGVICALVLSLCGVDDQTVAGEYSLTEIGMPKAWKEAVIQHLLNDPALQGSMAGALNMIGAKREAMLGTLRIIEEKFGGTQAYMVEKCGLTKEEVEKIRSNLVVEKPAIHQKFQHSL
ncbi:protein-tyrosine phosphatase-like protein [Bisporella sp. PMI_857]|nr:protein-tyrosine phosphatase-like protein [Bisporella sp. PMI_857]